MCYTQPYEQDFFLKKTKNVYWQTSNVKSHQQF